LAPALREFERPVLNLAAGMQEKNFNLPTRLFPPSKAGRKNPGVIKNQNTVFWKKTCKCRAMVMSKRSTLPSHYHEAGIVSLICRLLGNKIPREIVVKVSKAHSKKVKDEDSSVMGC
jgi:hypothetical protein